MVSNRFLANNLDYSDDNHLVGHCHIGIHLLCRLFGMHLHSPSSQNRDLWLCTTRSTSGRESSSTTLPSRPPTLFRRWQGGAHSPRWLASALPRCRDCWCASFLQDLHWFGTVDSPFIPSEMSAVLLKVPRFPAIETGGPSPWLRPHPRLLLVLGTSVSASSSVCVTFCDQGLRVSSKLPIFSIRSLQLCSDTKLWGIALGHNWAPIANGRNINENMIHALTPRDDTKY